MKNVVVGLCFAGLHLLSACVAPSTSKEYCDKAAAAMARGDWAAAVQAAETADRWEKEERDRRFARLMADAGTSRGTYQEDLRTRRTDWLLAQAHAKVGGNAKSREQLMWRFGKGDPDAMWALLEIFRAMGTQAEVESWLNQHKKPDGSWDEYRYGYPTAMSMLPLAYGGGDLESICFSVGMHSVSAYHDTQKASIGCLFGDLLFRRGLYDGALDSYQRAQGAISGSTECPRSPLDLRLAKAHAALGNAEIAKLFLDKVDVTELLGAGQSGELIACRDKTEQQLAALAVARGDLPTPPPGLALLTALDACVGVQRTTDAEGRVTWRGESTWSVSLASTGGLTAQIPGVDGLGGVSAEQRENPALWDPRRRCFDYGRGGNPLGCRFLLFANGDVFVGSHAFLGAGVYLSPTRPPYSGLCCFGMPRERAWTITKIIAQSPADGGKRTPVAGDEVALKAQLTDGSTFEGVGVCDGELLVPTRQASFVYPARGAFIGWFRDGKPHFGGFFSLNNQLELWRADYPGSAQLHVVYSDAAVSLGTIPERTNGIGLVDKYPWLDPFVWIPNRVFMVWDRPSGLQWRVDDSLKCKAYVNYERLAEADRHDAADSLLNASIAERNRRIAAERLADQRSRELEKQREAAEIAEYRRTHPNWQAEERAAAEEMRRQREALQFNPEPHNNACLKCGGTGSLYRAGGATQGWIWDSSSNGWRQGTTHSSGSSMTCNWCEGSGRR